MIPSRAVIPPTRARSPRSPRSPRSRRLEVVLALLLACGGCAPAPNERGDARTVAALRAEVLEADRAFDREADARGAPEAFRAFLTDDALLLSNGEQPALGPNEAFAQLSTFPKGAKLRWRPERAEVAASGDLAWTWGRYTFEAGDAKGVRSVHHGKYVTVWRKVEGHWRVAADIANGNDAPAAPAH